jgi:hypothetical protein
MAAPVWVLSVDLQTKTATFQTGLADAAKAARGSFQDIKDASKEMGDGVGEASGRTEYSMMHARHGVMLLGEEFGVHLPRGITAFIVSLGPVGAAMEAAFPFLAIILGATLLIEHLTKIGDASEKAAEAGRKMAEDMTLSGNKAEEAYIDAEIEVRNLAGLPAWDLLADKLRLKDVDRGIENVNRLSKSLDDLLKAHGATSNWNPFNWLDNSGDLQNKIAALKDEMQGKGETEEAAILQDKLAGQSKLLADMKGQADVSAVQLKNQQAYVDWLKQATAEIQHQADTALISESNKETKDRDAKIRQAEEQQQRLYETQQRGLEKRMKLEQEYDKKREESLNKGMEEAVKEGELEAQATMAVTKSILEAEKERARITEELGKEEAEHIRKMAGLELHAEEDLAKESVKLHRSRSEAIIAEQTAAENAEYAAQMHAYQIELAALDKYGKDYEVKIKQIQDREAELTKAHENKITEIKEKAQEERNATIIAAENRAGNELASGMMKVLKGQENFSHMMVSLGQQAASGMVQSLMEMETVEGRKKLSAARLAGAEGYQWGMEHGGPAAPILAPTLAALAFAGCLAFEEGGIVPGVERGDVVPARLTPGEGIIPKPLMDNLTHAAQSGNTGSGGDTHVHVHMTNHVNTIDGDGMQRTLEKHADVVEQHVHNALRKRAM